MDDEMLKQLKPMLTAIYEIFKDPETANSVATMYWGLYTALQNKGFTKDEAMQVLLTFNINSKK